MPTVTVALEGARHQAFTEATFFNEQERSRPWDEREQVELEVADDEPLGQILRRAGESLGIRAPGYTTEAPVPNFFAVFDEESPDQRALGGTTVTLVDADGRARWNQPWAAATYGELVRASDAGAIPGDVTRLYYVTHPAVGNGVLPTFIEILVGLKLVWDIMGAADTLEGNISLAQRVISTVRNRLGRGQETIKSKATDWSLQGGDPEAIRSMLGDRAWYPKTLAALLDCAEEEGVAVLEAFGFSESSDGAWHLCADQEATFLRNVYDEIVLAHNLGHEDFASTLEARINHYLASGMPLPRPFVDAEEFGDEAFDPGTIDEDPYLDDEGEGPRRELPDMPLEHLRVVCACGKKDCNVLAGFGIANGHMKLGFTEHTDHFVADPVLMVHFALEIAAGIDRAKREGDNG